MSDIKQAREALERIQCNYVYTFKARENGKTQLVHDLNTIKKALDEAEKNEQTLLIFKNALTVEHHNLRMIDNSDPLKDCVDYAVKALYSIKQNELREDLCETLREWVLKNAFPKEMHELNLIRTGFIIRVYKSKHTKTGYEMSIDDSDGNRVFKEITEEEYDMLEVLL